MIDEDDPDPRMAALARAQSAAMWHVPDRAEMEDILARYFFPPITPAVVDKLEAEFLQVRSSVVEESSKRQYFRSPTMWRGRAWYEESTGDRLDMNPRDLFGMMTNMFAEHNRSMPQPRPYCPEPFPGTWEQLEPVPTLDEPCLWHLSPEGGFRSNSPDVTATMRFWCIQRAFDDRDPKVSLVLWKEPFYGTWGNLHGIPPSATEIAGTHLGLYSNTPFRLRRVDTSPDDASP